MIDVPVSILDRANTRQGESEAESLHAVIERARRAEELGFARFWVAEHHGVPGIAGSAPAVLIAAVAAATDRIRVGSGGVMLPNHQPFVVAEQFATLQALYGDRIDLGVGRSVGFTGAVRDALRQGAAAAERFDDDIAELVSYLSGEAPVTARPRDNSATPVFVLATGRGVDTAARAGLPLVVGGPALSPSSASGTNSRLERYRQTFAPSPHCQQPHVIASVNIAIAHREQDARDMLLPEAWALAHASAHGEFPPLEPASAVRARNLTQRQVTAIDKTLSTAIYGEPEQVAEQLAELLAVTGANEILATGGAFDQAAQAESDSLLARLHLPGFFPGA